MKKVILLFTFIMLIFLGACVNDTTSKGYNLSYYELIPSLSIGEISLNPNEDINLISLGGEHSAITTTDNRMFTWGINNFGQLGVLDDESQSSPIDITSVLNLQDNESITLLSLGERHTGIVTSTNRILVWGANTYGQLGDGTRTGRFSPVDITNKFDFESGETIVQLDFGYTHSTLLTSFGNVYTWGNNATGQLGNNTIVNSSIPINITSFFMLEGEEKIVDISLGYVHSLALSSTGDVFAWGNNPYGQIGNGTTNLYIAPHNITDNLILNSNETVTDVTAGEYHSALITSQGRIYTWGRNHYGQIGNNTTVNQLLPIDITSAFDLVGTDLITQVSLGNAYSMAVTESNKFFIWGSLTNGSITETLNDNYLEPHELTQELLMTLLDQEVEISSGATHSAILSSNGEILIWGMNSKGQLGNGTTNNSLLPISIVQSNLKPVLLKTIKLAANESISTYLPEKSGFSFDGWYTTEAMNDLWAINSMPSNDVSLYGVWTIAP